MTSQTLQDKIAAIIVIAFAAALSIFEIRNNDIWWLLAVGRRILETKAFIYTDPFTFTMTGTPWSPQWYLAAITFYLVNGLASAVGLIVLRVVLVTATFAVLLRTLRLVGVRWLFLAPLLVIAILNAQTRFIVRAHLFEYLFLSILVGFLLTAHERRGRSFFVLPIALQIIWVNTHPSYLLGPILAALFFGGEWLSERLSRVTSAVRPLHHHDFKRAMLLVAVLGVACFVNPSPIAFIAQPLGGEQRELMSRFTLEWKSPFDPAIAAAWFHPYYEILLAIAGVAVLSCVRRLSLGPILLIIATAYASTQSHRFRVEFALVAIPMAAVLFRQSPWREAMIRQGRKKVLRWASVGAWAALAVLVVVSAGRIEVGRGVRDRYPDRAFAFAIDENIAHRPYHTIAFGSFMTWDLYGKRQAFIDGRNFDPVLYRDFLVAQTGDDAFARIAGKYRVDAAILPATESSDEGTQNVHRAIVRSPDWTLVYLDGLAYVYVRRADVDGEWLSVHEYREYHPIYFGQRQMDRAAVDRAIEELARAVSISPEYRTLWIDYGGALMAVGASDRATEAFQSAVDLDPEDAAALSQLANAAAAAGKIDVAIAAGERLTLVAPGGAAFTRLGQVHESVGNIAEAVRAYEAALAAGDAGSDPFTAIFNIHARAQRWDAAIEIALRLATADPSNYLGRYYRAVALSQDGRPREAISDAERAVQLNPGAVEVHFLLAQLYAGGEDYEKALARVDEILANRPEDPEAVALRAAILRAMEN